MSKRKPETLGEKIEWHRLLRGESYQELADAVGCSKAHIWKMAIGQTSNPTLSIMVALADHFHVSLDWLAGRNFP